MSRNEQALQAIIDGDDSSKLEPAQSRNERILHAIIDNEDLSKLPAPQSPIESLLIQVGEKIQQGGGGVSAEPLSVTENGEYTAPSGKAYTPVNVNVQPTLQQKTATENGVVTPDTGYDGLSQVNVDVQGGGGDTSAEDGIIQRTISGTYTNGRVTKIGVSAFLSCSSLTSVNFPSCTYISGYAFSGCSNLSTANFPACKTISTSAFAGCYNLTSVNFPSCIIIGGYAFISCRSLPAASFPMCQSIDGGAFSKCYKLLSLYLTGSSIPSLTASTVFYSTPIAGYTASTGGVYGSIYVPASLLTAYQSATNWAYFSDRFVAINE